MPTELANRRSKALAAAMSARGLSQAELARRSGVAQGHISNILSGKRGARIGIDVLFRLQKGLGDPPVDLVCGPTEGGPVVGFDEFLASPWGSDMPKEWIEFFGKANWAPGGRKVTLRDWFVYTQLVRGLPEADKETNK